MKVCFLGTAGYHPNEARHTSCIVLPSAGIVLDAGSGMFRLPQFIQTRTLDIFLSHAHLDHVIGLTYLLDILWQRPLDAVRVWSRAETLQAVAEHLFAAALFPVEPPYIACELHEPLTLPGSCTVRHCHLEHPGGSLGLRLDWPDRSLAYITDTTARGAASNYLDFVRGVDLLVHEGNFSDGQAERAELTGHSCVTSVAELARAAGVGRLVLTHWNPLAPEPDSACLDPLRLIHPLTEFAHDGWSIDF